MIRFTTDASAFAKALRAVIGAVERTNTIPIVGNILIEASADGSIRLTGTNTTIYASRILTGSVDKAGATTVPAHRFTDVIGALEDGAQVEVSEPENASQLTLISGRSRFRFAVLPAANFPPSKFGTLVASFSLPAQTLREALATVTHAIAKEEVRYWLNGVLFHTGGTDKLRLAATDGHRMARVVLPQPAGAEHLPDTIVSAATLSLVTKAAADHDGDVLIEVSDSTVRFSLGQVVISAKVVEGNFPDYTRVIPSSPNISLKADADDLRAAVRRISMIQDSKTRGLRILADNGLQISAATSNGTDGNEQVMCERSGAKIEIGFNGAYLSDCLDALDSDIVELGIDDAGGPALITSPARPDATLVLMPMRV